MNEKQKMRKEWITQRSEQLPEQELNGNSCSKGIE
jgi:hypothetical protein